RVDSSVFEQLDVREKNGYLRLFIDMKFDDGSIEPGLIYIATPDNEAFLGDASDYDIALQIFNASGPSGPNRDYLLGLAESLREMGLKDDHVFGIEKHLKRLMGV
ncbi:MAG: gamma-glutamylcyclotransferase, partial [Gammaproteobacteria bacterium]|nr:gamma-glutamylcyclotransferase [Gammaproteobacteria bacterium]